ncbi:MAG: AAA family ATPase, partial [Planctomycetes bacterium]|nr:AAA family ATPase [Planctomycetota bacterium]
MRVLAVRGHDLASLGGSFTLDLAASPLADAGLVVVTGPTGAGKSTLLDAMCLALFDQTPRLRGRGAPVGFLEEADRKALSSADPRCLVRRGAVEAGAEVDFVGRDGRRWRAAWSVRRARGRPDGRLQAQTLSLTCLDTGERRGGTRTETLQAIEEALGLDYTAFCRSALLAQGDFASFLQARGSERAALLERLTGTELYGALSIAAHQRAASEARALEQLQARLDGLQLLAPLERAELLREGALRRDALVAAR